MIPLQLGMVIVTLVLVFRLRLLVLALRLNVVLGALLSQLPHAARAAFPLRRMGCCSAPHCLLNTLWRTQQQFFWPPPRGGTGFSN